MEQAVGGESKRGQVTGTRLGKDISKVSTSIKKVGEARL